ncbi:MAG TPA: type III-B CRISPR-associated protein Cas10/Cmr2 [Sulfurivirga caldicuralii]|nr:type III-B CRISPR-associated protein Cas10/Cmr2 [Sulfurivirga caldicuralii]
MGENKCLQADWQIKLDAWVHDPGEKALILLRGKGHEAGTVAKVRQALGIEQEHDYTRRADWWAASADRLQWPKGWNDQVRWYQQPELVHPLSANPLDVKLKVGDFSDTDVDEIEERSTAHSLDLIQRAGEDDRRRYLALWRFEPVLQGEVDNHGKLGKLWEVLPADSRIPDHSIWDHKDLTSAVAGAMASDSKGEVALLAMTLGPVQSFISAARSTTDLWAGSHLLSRLSWEMMRPLVEQLGPDAVLYPRLRGIPQVDVWLQEQLGQGFADLFAQLDWKKQSATNTNPLFVGAMPNRFVALVPAAHVETLAQQCEDAVRKWLSDLGQDVVERLLKTAGIPPKQDHYCYEQMARQLKGFPEVYWASVSFGLIETDERMRVKSSQALEQAAAPFWPEDGVPFFKSQYWKLIGEKEYAGEIDFFLPRPSTLYPVVYELLERLLAAVKSIRPFEQIEEKGWRCSLTGEAEWLTHDPQLLATYQGQKTAQQDLWQHIAQKRPSWAKQGERLSALPAIKRVWPDIFAQEVAQALGSNQSKAARFVVSTHVMANAKALEKLAEAETLPLPDVAQQRLNQEDLPRYALPRRIAQLINESQRIKNKKQRFKALWALLDVLENSDDATLSDADKKAIRKAVYKVFANSGEQPETYYALLQLDGDEMGAWLSGEHAAAYQDYFHRQLRAQFDRASDPLAQLARMQRLVTPAYHMSISAALNQFALHIAPAIVQQAYSGQLIYAGGDDVLAMLPTADALAVALRLQQAYRGEDGFSLQPRGIDLTGGNGFVWQQGQLVQVMGTKATVSAGLVIAHHKAPLGWVLRQVRAAEAAAKEAGRNRLNITLIKRAGTITRLTLKWSEVEQFEQLRDLLSAEQVSRRAAYNLNNWLKDMPDDMDALKTLIAYQMRRQGVDAGEAKDMAAWLVEGVSTRQESGQNGLDWLKDVLIVAEFLARDTRSGGE